MHACILTNFVHVYNRIFLCKRTKCQEEYNAEENPIPHEV